MNSRIVLLLSSPHLTAPLGKPRDGRCGMIFLFRSSTETLMRNCSKKIQADISSRKNLKTKIYIRKVTTKMKTTISPFKTPTAVRMCLILCKLCLIRIIERRRNYIMMLEYEIKILIIVRASAPGGREDRHLSFLNPLSSVLCCSI